MPKFYVHYSSSVLPFVSARWDFVYNNLLFACRFFSCSYSRGPNLNKHSDMLMFNFMFVDHASLYDPCK